MRKIFVVLLVLAIAGGALAQEAEDKGTWGTWSGEVGLTTGFDMGKEAGADDGYATFAGGGPGDAFLKIKWDYTKGNWKIELPFTIDKYGVHTFAGLNDDEDAFDGKLAKVEYTDGPLTVTLPFGFALTDRTNATGDAKEFDLFDALNINFWGSSDISAKYEGDTFAFGLGVGDLWSYSYGNATQIIPEKKFSAWGWYDLDLLDGLRLAVSYRGEGTEWWRTSTVVLTGKVGFWPDDGDDLYTIGIDNEYDYHWENIGGDHSGLALKLNIGDFAAGVSFVSEDISDFEMFGEDGYAIDFFNHMTFGLGYFTDAFSASAMLGIEKDYFNIYAGTSIAIGDAVSIGLDTSIFINTDKDVKEDKAQFNIGASFDFNSDAIEEGFWAGLKVAAVDLARKGEGDKDKSDMELGAMLRLGYNTPLSDVLQLNFGAGVFMHVIPDGEVFGLDLRVKPELVWKVIGDNGSITVANEFGMAGGKSGSDDFEAGIFNKLTFAFSWKF